MSKKKRKRKQRITRAIRRQLDNRIHPPEQLIDLSNIKLIYDDNMMCYNNV